MPITYTICKHPRVTYARYVGTVTLNELLMNYMNYIRDDLYEPGIPELIDATDVGTFTANGVLLRTIATTVDMINKGKATTVTSIYAPTPSALAVGKRYQKICRNLSGLTVHVNKDAEAAISKLGLPYRSIAELKQAIEA